MASFPYDVTLTIEGSSAKGFMLSSPPGQTKQLSIGEVAAPQGQYALNRIKAPEIQTHTDFDPAKDQSLAQGDLSGGVGSLELDDKSDGDGYWWSSGIVTHVPGRNYIAPAVSALTVTGAVADVGGFTTYLTAAGVRYDFHWQSTKLYRRDASNGTNAWTLVYTASVAITSVVIINGSALICAPTTASATEDFYYQADPTAAATWTPTAANHAVFSVALGKPKFMLALRGWTYAVVDNRKVFYNADFTTDTWLGPIDTSLTGNFSGPPGDTSHVFTAVKAINDYLFVLKKDAGYNIDSQQEVTEVLWQWKDKPSDSQFKHVTVGGDLLYYSVAPEVYAYDPQTGRNPPVGLSRQSGFSCQDILGVGADNQYVYVLAKIRVPTLRTDPSAALLRGVRVSASKWNWEVIWEDTASTAYATLGVVPYGIGSRVYWGTTGGGTVTHMDVPADWDESTGTAFQAQADLYMSIWRTGFPNFVKFWPWVSTYTEGCSASNTIAVAYSVDQGATFTALATISSNGLNNTTLPSIEGQSMVLRFRYVSAGTVTPVLRVFDLHSRPRFRYLQQYTLAVRCGDYLELQNGSRASETGAELVTNLEAARTSDLTVTYQDFLGHSHVVSVDALSFKPVRYEAAEKNGYGLYELEAQLVLSRLDKGA